MLILVKDIEFIEIKVYIKKRSKRVRFVSV